MGEPYRGEFQKAMQAEIDELTEHNTWTLVPRSTIPEGVTTLPGTWAFKIKRFPDGRLRNLRQDFMQGVINRWRAYTTLTNMHQ